MKPPSGFKGELYPLEHKFDYALGLSVASTGESNCILTLVKNYKSVDNPNTVKTNPHNGSFMKETGAICAPMSIIDKLKLSIKFSLTKNAINTSFLKAVNFKWFPIFFSFHEKLEAADLKTTTTVGQLLSVTHDSTQEDVTPTFSTVKTNTTGASDLVHPTSAINFTEVFGTLNLTTNTGMEGAIIDYDVLRNAMRYYTNKGALKACMGKIRSVVLTEHKPFHNVFIDKFVPRPIRRIMPYSFFAIAIIIPKENTPDQFYASNGAGASMSDIGVKLHTIYHEWHADHDQEMT